jgi:hypothetical protein
MSAHDHNGDHGTPPMGADGVDDRDAALLELLGQALRAAEPVPAAVLSAARGAVAWRTIDQDLAELVFDSASELTGVRDPSAPRQLTFRSGEVEIELMVVEPVRRRVLGQIVPARTATVRLQGAGIDVEQTSDRFGRFSFEEVHAGPVRLTVAATPGDRDIATDWVLL